MIDRTVFASDARNSHPGGGIAKCALLVFLLAQSLSAQQLFASRCAACHGEEARGTAKGPGLAMNPRVAEQSAEQLRAYLERGNPGAGMPSFADPQICRTKFPAMAPPRAPQQNPGSPSHR